MRARNFCTPVLVLQVVLLFIFKVNMQEFSWQYSIGLQLFRHWALLTEHFQCNSFFSFFGFFAVTLCSGVMLSQNSNIYNCSLWQGTAPKFSFLQCSAVSKPGWSTASSICKEIEPKYWKLPVSVLPIKIEGENYNDTIGFKIMLRVKKRARFFPYLWLSALQWIIFLLGPFYIVIQLKT